MGTPKASARGHGAGGSRLRWSVWQMVATFALLTFLPLALLSYLAVSSSGDAVSNQVRSKVLAAARLEAGVVSARMQVLRELTVSVATRPLLVDDLGNGVVADRKIAALQKMLNSVLPLDPGFLGNAVTDPSGRMIALSPADPAVLGKSFSNRDWYKGVTRTGAPYVSEAFRSFLPGTPLVVGIAVPIDSLSTGSSAVIGYLVFTYRLTAMQQFLEGFGSDAGISLTVTDQSGELLTGPVPPTKLVSVAQDPRVRRSLLGESGTISIGSGTRRVLSGFAPVAGIGWAVHADVSEAVAFAPVGQLRNKVVAVAAALAVVLLIALVLLARLWRRRDEAESRLQRNEQELVLAQDVAHMGSFRLDFGSGAMTWSPSLFNIMGRAEEAGPPTRAEFMGGLGPDDRALMADAEGRGIKAGTAFDFDHRVTLADGTVRWFHTSAEPTLGTDGAATGLLGTSIDISERKSAESELAVRARELERLNRDLGRSNDELEQFAYVASHDLSEPLRAVSGPISLLARRYQGQLDEEADQFIGFAVDGCERMQHMIDDLLLFSRVGRVEGTVEPVDTNLVVKSVLVALGPAIVEANAIVDVDPLPVVTVEATQLTHVFQNLVSNALKFRTPGVQPQVRVAAEPRVGSWRFTVTDNGIGIKPEHRERIFGMFKRLHGRDEYPGTGIGLALVEKIVERHGGHVGVDNNPEGQGSRFWFTLPSQEKQVT